jgi:flagellar FliL protein
VVQLSTDQVIEELTNRKPQIKDAVITVLSSKTPDEILTIQGKYDMKVEIVKRINSLLTTGVVRELYLVEFVIQ